MTAADYIPSTVANPAIYHEGWVDFNKNGVMDPFEDPERPVNERVEDLLSQMTMEEKVAQLGSGISVPETGIGNLTSAVRPFPPRQGAMRANELQVRAIETTRLGIPATIHEECLHGCLADFSTSFPQAIALAATWDPELVNRVARAIAKEARARGIRQCLSPVADVARDVRAGRTEETYGEDPHLASIMGAAFCKAMRQEGIIATPKHFVANFVGDGGRDSNEIHFSERVIREAYFPSFKACIDAGALSLMASYGSLDGVPCSSNHWLLTQVLREEWGFEGFVVSDYGSVNGILGKHHVVSTPEEVPKVALEAGLDMELPRTDFFGDPLLRALRSGMVDLKLIDESVRRILRAKFMIGLFDSPFVDPDEAERLCGCDEHTRLALEAARKSVVLLKNENSLLPLRSDEVKSVAVLGPASDELRLGGYSGTPPRGVRPLDAIRGKLKTGTKVYHERACAVTVGKYLPVQSSCLVPPHHKGGKHGLKGEYFDNPDLAGKPALVRLDSEVDFDWGIGSPDPKIPCDNFSVRWTGKLVPPESRSYEFNLAADDGVRLWLDGRLLIDSWHDRGLTSDIVQVRMQKGKSHDIKIEYYERTGTAIAQFSWDYRSEVPEGIAKAARLARRADIAVVFAGIVEGEGKDRASLELPAPQEMLIEEVAKTGTPTVVVLLTGSPVTGDWINGVGALIQAWYPGQEGGEAIAETLFGENNPGGKLPVTWPRSVGQLPLYYNHKPTGRTYDYVDMPGTPLFPFGHGLSYTEFAYRDLTIEKGDKRGKTSIGLRVRNVGDVKGDEVVQLYLHDRVSSVARPVQELKGFRRLTLEPKEEVLVHFDVSSADLVFLGQDMRPVFEPGEFDVMLGRSSGDIRLTGVLNLKEIP